jgi:hypothetical protein
VLDAVGDEAFAVETAQPVARRQPHEPARIAGDVLHHRAGQAIGWPISDDGQPLGAYHGYRNAQQYRQRDRTENAEGKPPSGTGRHDACWNRHSALQIIG